MNANKVLADPVQILANWLREKLDDLAPGGNGTRTVYDYVKGPLLGSYDHVGEIAALKAMRDRCGA